MTDEELAEMEAELDEIGQELGDLQAQLEN
jgi:hypothetical protein